MRMFM